MSVQWGSAGQLTTNKIRLENIPSGFGKDHQVNSKVWCGINAVPYGCVYQFWEQRKKDQRKLLLFCSVKTGIFLSVKSKLFNQFLRYFLLHNLSPIVGNVSPVYVMYIKHVSRRRKRRFLWIDVLSTKYQQTRYYCYTILFAYLFDKTCQCNHLNTDIEMISHLEVEDSL